MDGGHAGARRARRAEGRQARRIHDDRGRSRVQHAGAVRADRDYQIAPPSRIDLEEVLGLIRDEKYFVQDAPRQTGKTSALLALRDLLNSGEAGDFRCLYAKLENGQAMRENVAEAMRTVLAELAYQASVALGDETLDELWPALLERVGPAQALRLALARWCMADPRPLYSDGPPRIANPIYEEVVPRHLNHAVQIGPPQPFGIQFTSRSPASISDTSR